MLLGATGYTGRLTAEALASAGARPVLAGRDRTRLQALAVRLGGLDVAEADTSRPDSVRALAGAGDVLVSTVGPFLTRGEPAVRAAVEAGAAYLDSTGEPPFLRRVVEEFGPRAEGRCGLVPGFGYDFVPGNLAGAHALAEAPAASRVTVGYFATGRGGFSSGTRASGAGLLLEPGFAWRDGRLRRERTARRVRSFRIGGRDRLAVSYAGSEHYALPRLAPGLREVEVYLGWFGNRSRAVQAFSAAGAPLARLPGVRVLAERPPARCPAGPARAPTRRPGGPAAPWSSPWPPTTTARNWPGPTCRAPTPIPSPPASWPGAPPAPPPPAWREPAPSARSTPSASRRCGPAPPAAAWNGPTPEPRPAPTGPGTPG